MRIILTGGNGNVALGVVQRLVEVGQLKPDEVQSYPGSNELYRVLEKFISIVYNKIRIGSKTIVYFVSNKII